jgi:hypothetical protein
VHGQAEACPAQTFSVGQGSSANTRVGAVCGLQMDWQWIVYSALYARLLKPSLESVPCFCPYHIEMVAWLDAAVSQWGESDAGEVS